MSWTEELLLVLILAFLARATPPAAAAVRRAGYGLILVLLYLLAGEGDGVFRLPAVISTQALLVSLVWVQWRSAPRRP